MVSAPHLVKSRGIRVSETTRTQSGIFDSYIKVSVAYDGFERTVAGTVFSDKKPRFIQIKGINLDAEVGEHMLYTTNKDEPGIIGTLGTILGDASVNIANFHLGRNAQGGDAIALLYLDAPMNPDALGALMNSGKFQQAKPLEFDVE